MRIAFYDFAVSPFSYDFVQFLVCARARGCDHVVFVEGDRGWSKFDDRDQERVRFYSILAPLAGSFSFMTREQAKDLWSPDCYPEGYKLTEPKQGHAMQLAMTALNLVPLRPHPSAVEKIRTLIDNRRPVVITLRQTDVKPERNSNLRAWLRFAAHLRERGVDVVIVPDSEHLSVHTMCQVMPEAATDVQLRLALYSCARVNMGVNNGPLALCLYSDLPLLYFRPINAKYQESDAGAWAAAGLRKGDQPEWFNEQQRIVWEDDEYDVILAAYNALTSEQKAAA